MLYPCLIGVDLRQRVFYGAEIQKVKMRTPHARSAPSPMTVMVMMMEFRMRRITAHPSPIPIRVTPMAMG
jgi:hypothetical protein